MSIKELSQLKEENVIYDRTAGTAYNIIKIYKNGILTYYEWTNSYGRFTENRFLKKEELLCKDMILI